MIKYLSQYILNSESHGLVYFFMDTDFKMKGSK
jgi:hypothetical protein